MELCKFMDPLIEHTLDQNKTPSNSYYMQYATLVMLLYATLLYSAVLYCAVGTNKNQKKSP